MMEKNLYENQAQSSLDFALQFFNTKRPKHSRNSIATVAMVASFLYLLKKDALRIKYNANRKNDNPFFQIDSSYINKFAPDMLKLWNDSGYETVAFCSILPINDPLFDVIERNIGILYDKSVSNDVLDIIKGSISGKIIPEEYVGVLDNLLIDNRELGLFGQPKEFAILAANLLDVKGKSVFNPFSGMMSFATTFVGYKECIGIDINREVCDYSILRVALSNKPVDCTKVICSDINTWTDRKYDVIVTNPPLGIRMKMCDSDSLGNEELSTIALRRFENTTSEDGQLLTFVTSSILFSAAYSSLRKELTKKNYLDSVITLPSNILSYTGASLAVIVLKKNRQHDDPIKMIDATQMLIGERSRVICVEEIMRAYSLPSDNSLELTVDDIANKRWSWYSVFYKGAAQETIRDGYDTISLADLLIRERGTSRFSDKEGKCVSTGVLPLEWTNYNLSADKIEVTDNLRHARKICKPVLLLSTVGKSARAAYCEASESSPVFITPSVNAYTLSKPNIHYGYLCMELSKKFVPLVGSYIPNIYQQSFVLTKIDFPSLVNKDSYIQQENLYKEAKTAVLMSKAREMGLQEVIENMKNVYINEIRSRKHDMMPHLRQIGSAAKNIDIYLSNKDSYTEQEFIKNIKEEVDNQQKAVVSLQTLLSIFSRESKFGSPEILNLDKFFAEKDAVVDNFQIEHNTDYQALLEYGFDIPDALCNNYDFAKGEKTSTEMLKGRPSYAEGINVNIAKDDLQRLCDNIIGNAIKHGFTDSERTDYSITIELTIDKNRDMFQIDFRNNGNPLPKGLDKLRYGLKGEKAGKTAGTGEGGYIVKSIVEHYNGDYDIFCILSGSEYLTTVRIYLPIYRENEK